MRRERPQAPERDAAQQQDLLRQAHGPEEDRARHAHDPEGRRGGAVVPTPAGCHPEKKWCQLADQPGRGAS